MQGGLKLKQAADMIYLDHNATTPIKPEVIAEMKRVMEIGGNPSSAHTVGRGAKAILESSRQIISNEINCRSQKIIFTGGGTESNNIALKAAGYQHIILSETEHDSILGIQENFTGTIDCLAVDNNGYISPDVLRKALENAPRNSSGNSSGTGPEKCLVSLMLANNETGVVQDIKTLADITHEFGACFHTDAIQAFGKIPVDFRALGVDMMSLSGHKINGPQGVGALVALEKINIQSLSFGGGQEVGRRAGTENLAAIAGFAKAVEFIPENLKNMSAVEKMRNRIEQEIQTHAPCVFFYGASSHRLPNTSTILMPRT